MTIRYKNERPANGLTGVLIFDSVDNSPIFRIYDKNTEEGFKDYYIWHDDMTITIHKDELASLYDVQDEGEEFSILDHRSDVLGYIEVEDTEYCNKCGALLMADGNDSYCPKCREIGDE